jgi:metal-responsive CopG/Arc/MetJ family transcriptional regulator
MYMKPIQVMFDERLLARLDATSEVKKQGRSAVLRHAVEEYLRRHRRYSIAEQYREAYADSNGLGDEYPGWKEQGEWPED